MPVRYEDGGSYELEEPMIVRCARQRTPRPDEGFSLIELLVATTVLVIVTSATAAILIQALRTVSENQDRVVAASVARSELERLRALGAVEIPQGLTSRTDTSTGFTVTTSATWVAAGQTGSPCESGATTTQQRSYVRVRIEAIGGRLTGPQVIDAIVPPRDDVPSAKTASITVAVRDQANSPVAGAQVRISSAATGATTQTRSTDTNGCLFFTDLVPGTWQVLLLLTSPDMVRPGTTTTQTTAALGVGQNSPHSFFAARSVNEITLDATSADYPLPTNIPLRGSFGTWTSAVPTTMPAAPIRLTRAANGLLWPDPAGFSATLGCNDAPTSSIIVEPGGTSAVTLSTVSIDVLGQAQQQVTISHAKETAPSPCATVISNTVTLKPAADLPAELGRARLSLPYGTWKVEAVLELAKTVTLTQASANPCLVSWPESIPLGKDLKPIYVSTGTPC